MDEKNTNIEYKTLRSTGIDLFKLRKMQEWRLILRILRVFNDITLAPGLSFLIRFSPSDRTLSPIKGAVDWHLLRWRSSMAAEAVRNVIEPLRAHEANPSHEIWELIRNDSGLSMIWTELSSDKYKRETEKAKGVRDKLFAHYDQGPINCAFEKLLQLHPNNQTEKAIGWHMQSEGDQGQISRNVLLDELLNLAWYETYEIEVTKDGPNAEQVNVAAKDLIEFLSLVANFVNGVIIAYVEKYDLDTIETNPPWFAESES